MERVWAIHRGPIRFRRSEVVSACADNPSTAGLELRMPGTAVPGVIKAGCYLTSEGSEFWYVTRQHFECALCIGVQHPRYRRVVLGVSEPHAWAQRITNWLEGKGEFAPRAPWLFGLTPRQVRG